VRVARTPVPAGGAAFEPAPYSGAMRAISEPCWHHFLEHTSEARIEIGAPDLGGLLVEAGRALAELLLGERPGAAQGRAREIELRSIDREALLVAWLNELLFFAETELCVASDFDVLEATDTRLRVRVRGVPTEVAPSKVKAATHHDLEIAERDGALVARVILDL
jgi:SHS2 domain-containing protein